MHLLFGVILRRCRFIFIRMNGVWDRETSVPSCRGEVLISTANVAGAGYSRLRA